MKNKVNLNLKAAIIKSEEFKGIRDFANFIEMPMTTFSYKMNGHGCFTETEMQIISEALNVSPMDIFFKSKVIERITA